MKFPLGIAALSYVAGLLLAEVFQPPLPALFAVSLVVAAAAIFISRTRAFLVWPLLVLTAWTNSVCHTAILSPHDLRHILNGEPEQVVMRGVLSVTPEQRVRISRGVERTGTRAYLDATEVLCNGSWLPAHGQLVVFSSVLDSNYFSGQRVEVKGVASHPSPALTDGMFDYRAYLQRQGIYFQLRTTDSTDWQILEPRLSKPPISDWFIAWAQKTLSRGLPENDERLRLLYSMALGWRNALPNDVYIPFQRSGTMHIFAISGLHIALIAEILVLLLRAVRVSRLGCGIVVIPLIWFYTAATGWQPSAIRATIMMSVVIGGWALKRPSNLLNSLGAAGLIILLWQPQQFFQLGFQLSFLVVLSIALLLPPLEKWRDRILQTDPLLPAELLPRWQKLLRPPLHWGLTTVAISLAAWLGAWPLTAHYFHLFSPVTLLANVLVVPLSGFALAACTGSLICGAWLPWLSEVFNHAAWALMWLMVEISERVTTLPAAFKFVKSLAAADFIIYYGVLFVLLSGWIFKARRWTWAVAGMVVIAGYYGWRRERAHDGMTLTCLPLSGGTSIFCDRPGSGNDLLIDCGNAAAVETLIEPFLRAKGINTLSQLLLTHGDVNHVGGALPLLDEMPVRQIVVSDAPFRSTAYRRLMREIENVENMLTIRRDNRVGGLRVLHPGPERFARADDASVVLMGGFYGTRVLLLSELGRPGQNALFASQQDIQADIVISGMPEESEPLSDTLLNVIQPRVIVLMDSTFPAHKKAGNPLRARLEQHGVPVIYATDSGAVTFSINKKGWRLKTSDGTSISSDKLPKMEPRQLHETLEEETEFTETR